MALRGYPELSLYAIIAAALFDFLDGLAARLLSAYSVIGKDLDSLADLVSFGVAPGMMLFVFLDNLQKSIFWLNPVYGYLFLLSSLCIPVLSALRLAKFNNDTRQSSSFIGLPVPAHALFWGSLLQFLPDQSFFSPLQLLFATSFLAIVTPLLFVSPLKMFSLKVSGLRWRSNELRYILLIISILCISICGVVGISISIVLYVLLSIISSLNGRNK
jgi:CDP-diacylglycerol--serine O-phosphatidyltransferase